MLQFLGDAFDLCHMHGKAQTDMRLPGQKKLFIDILNRFRSGNAKPKEVEFVNMCLDQIDSQPDILDTLTQEEKDQLQSQIHQQLSTRIQPTADRSVIQMQPRFSWKKIAAAASIVCIISTGAYYFYQHEQLKKEIANVKKGKPAQQTVSGSKKAILTLADGSTIELEADNQVIRQGNTSIHQNKGQLVYASDNDKLNTGFNTLATPRGKQFEISFSDGSRAWLNSASSLRYPTAFTENERIVELNGQGYFEIARNPNKPFKVKVNGVEINVLGTHFDVMAYDDEHSVNTTLLEGEVLVAKGTEKHLLKPGQQAVAGNGSSRMLIREADLAQTIAWKNGLFLFSNMHLSTILREVARWYDVQIIQETDLSNLKELYGGSITRAQALPEALKMLEAGGSIKFRISGNKVYVSR